MKLIDNSFWFSSYTIPTLQGKTKSDQLGEDSPSLFVLNIKDINIYQTNKEWEVRAVSSVTLNLKRISEFLSR